MSCTQRGRWARVETHFTQDLNSSGLTATRQSIRTQHNHLLFLNLFRAFPSWPGFSWESCGLAPKWAGCSLNRSSRPCAWWQWTPPPHPHLQSGWGDCFWSLQELLFFYFWWLGWRGPVVFDVLWAWETNMLCGPLALRRIDPFPLTPWKQEMNMENPLWVLGEGGTHTS